MPPALPARSSVVTPRHRRVTALALVVVLAACGGGGGGDGTGGGGITPPAPTATVTGVVRLADGVAPLAGAAVRAGNASATSDATGRYTLAGVPVGGGVELTATLAGYDDYRATIAVAAGGATHDVALRRRTVYSAAEGSVYVPADAARLRGALVYVFGGTARGIADGVTTVPDPRFEPAIRAMRLALVRFADDNALALVGMEGGATTTAAAVQALLRTVATAAGRPELEQAPLLVYGGSAGAPAAFEVVQALPTRVAGFFLSIANTPTTAPSNAALATPGFILLAERDEAALNTGTTAFWAAARAGGASWGLAVERNQVHTGLSSRALAYYMTWLGAVHAGRLPAGNAGGALLAMPEASGWLGDRTTFAVAPFATYPGTRTTATWLPTQGVAEAWQAFSAGITP